jgi:hypothetical protein
MNVAQRVEVTLLDDLDLAEGREVEAVRTFGFELDGAAYEIDLNAEHEKQILTAMSPYVQNARLVKRPGKAGTRPRSGRRRASEIRAWARDRGMQLNDRGRIPRDIEAQYDREHPA